MYGFLATLMEAVMDTVKKNKEEKVVYETPKVEKLGKLSQLIQGSTGSGRDAAPLPGVGPENP